MLGRGFCGRGFGGGGGGLRRVGLFFCRWPANGEVLAHFFEFFGADAFDGEKVVDRFEGAVGFAGVEDFLRGGRADAGDLLEIGRAGRVDIDGMRGRLLLREGQRKWRECEHKDGEENARCRISPLEHGAIMPE